MTVKTKPGMSLAFLDAAVKKKRAEQAALRSGEASEAPAVEEVARELDVKTGEAEALLQHKGSALAVFVAKIDAAKKQ